MKICNIFVLIAPVLCCIYGCKNIDTYFPPSDLEGAWRIAVTNEDIQRVAGMDKSKLEDAFEFVKRTTKNGGLLVVRHGYLVYENYFGKGQREATPNLGSCGKSYTWRRRHCPAKH